MIYEKRPNLKDLAAATLSEHNPDPVPVKILDREGNERGTAMLLERKYSKYQPDGLPYIKQEKENKTNDNTCIVWSFQKWIIKWVEHTRLAGRRDAVDVHYFLKQTTKDFSHYPEARVYSGLEESIYEDGYVLFLDIPELLIPEFNTSKTANMLHAILHQIECELIVPESAWNLDDPFIKTWADDSYPSIEGSWSDKVRTFVDFKEIDNFVILTTRKDIPDDLKKQAIKCSKKGLTSKQAQILLRQFIKRT